MTLSFAVQVVGVEDLDVMMIFGAFRYALVVWKIKKNWIFRHEAKI